MTETEPGSCRMTGPQGRAADKRAVLRQGMKEGRKVCSRTAGGVGKAVMGSCPGTGDCL